MDQELDIIGNEQAVLLGLIAALKGGEQAMFRAPTPAADAIGYPGGTQTDVGAALGRLQKASGLTDKQVRFKIDPSTQGHNGKYVNRPGYGVAVNPKADIINAAHEIGHVASVYGGGIGKYAREASDYLADDPKLSKALKQATAFAPALQAHATPANLTKTMRMLAPAATAGLIDGDNDMAQSAAVALALSSPTLIDEALASKNALDIMKKAGTPASGRQMRRLAGSYLGYLAQPLAMAAGGNLIANLLT